MGYPCLIPDLREKVFRFSLLSVTLVLGMSSMASIMLRHHFFLFKKKIFLMFIFERERERASTCTSRGGAEREREIQNLKQVPALGLTNYEIMA